ncbi:MAG TPA: TetR family transcriptional regulator [Acidimicrobiales bacterium]|jgi:AcrR family transcriptional regulator|nr:TetR family transcriptional regulator [Acidimicrobiales bacterium]
MSDLAVATAVDGSPLTPKAMVRRQRIVEAAIELGTEGGYEAVHMRVVAERAGVALATVYRYFESKDHLLSAAVSEWTSQLQAQLARSPARGTEAVDQLVDVLRRASRALERRPQFAAALIRALHSPDQGVAGAAADVRHQIRAMAAPILADLPETDVEGIVSVLGAVWNSAIMSWANGRAPISSIGDELENAARLLLAGR